jgi:hypothetical protein
MSIDQFRTLQDHLLKGDKDSVEACAAQLLNTDLSATQQALVLQLQGQRQRSLALRFSPQLALRELERFLLPQPLFEHRAQWLSLMQQLVRHGHGPALLRLLARTASRYPLEQQRCDLVQMINEHDGFQLAKHPELRPLWLRQQRLMIQG